MLTKDTNNLPGQIITFYSYKGGTGRSMAVANLSCLLGRDLSRTSQRVLIMDWDLEAPGLHRYFSARCELPQFREQEGVANYFQALIGLLQDSPELYQALTAPGGCKLLEQTMPLGRYITPDVVPGVDFMRAGLFNSDYARLASAFNWVNFYNQFGGVIRTFREMLAENYAYILIDSRTGITDVSGICTTLLPEKLVGVFVPNRQSLDGLCDIVRQAIDYRSKADDDFRPLSVFPLPSRIENAEKGLKDEWRTTYQKTFEALFKQEYQINNCDLTDYFTEVSLPHTSYYAYGEKIAVLEEKVRDAQSLSTAYARFFDRLFHLDTPWELPETSPQTAVALSAPAPTRFTEPLYDAFLSYAKADQVDVARMEAKLSELDVRCFFDKRDLLPGEEWVSAISQAMAASRAVLVFFGPTGTPPWSDQSSLSMLESYAKQPEKRVIPVLLPGASLDTFRPPTFLSNFLAVEIGSLRDQDGVLRIARAVLATRAGSDLAPSMPTPRRGARAWIGPAATAAVVLIAAFTGYFGFLRHSEPRPSIANPPSNSTRAGSSTPSIPGGKTPPALSCYVDTASNWNWSKADAPTIELKIDGTQIGQVLLDKNADAVLPFPCQSGKQNELFVQAHFASDNPSCTYRFQVDEPQHYNLQIAIAPQKNITCSLSPVPALPAWGVMVSADKTLEPAPGSNGGPSAEWEPVRAWRAGYKNAVIFHQGTYFWTVIPEPDQPSAEATMRKLRTSPLYKSWADATVLEISKWCPGARYEKTLQVAEASIALYECESTPPK